MNPSPLDRGLLCASCGYEDAGPHEVGPPCPACGSQATAVRWMLGVDGVDRLRAWCRRNVARVAVVPLRASVVRWLARVST